MPKHRVLIATPAYSGALKVDHAESVEQLLLLAQRHDVEFARARPMAVGVLPRVRNVLAAQAIGQGFTHILFIDDDIGFDPGDVFRLLDHDVDIVAAAPQKRMRRWNETPPNLAFRLKREGASYDADTGLMECLDVATAFCLIKTDLMRRMLEAGAVERFVYHTVSAENAPYLAKFFHYPLAPVEPTDREWAYCEAVGIDPRTAKIDVGEDYAFTRAARAFGAKVYVDVGVRLRHWDGCIQHDYALADEVDRVYRAGRVMQGSGPDAPRISILLPTRGRVEGLRRALHSMAATARRPERLEVLLGVDSDDVETLNYVMDGKSPLPVHLVAGPRQATLGMLWNAMAGSATGGIIQWMADDFVIEGRFWDDDLRAIVDQMPKGLGIAYLPNTDVPASFVGLPGVTRAMMQRLIDTQGFFAPPWWPNWFADTWFDELATLIGGAHAISAMAVGDRSPSHRIRDLPFWADLFERTRPMREATAKALVREMYPEVIALRHLADFPARRAACIEKTAPLRNRKVIDLSEANAVQAGRDAGYDAAFNAACALLRRLEDHNEPQGDQRATGS